MAATRQLKGRPRVRESLAHKLGIVHPSSEYTEEESRFLVAVDAWKLKHRTRFPTNIDLLRIAKGMGYGLGK